MAELHVSEYMNPSDSNSITFDQRKKQIEVEQKQEEEERQRQKRSPYNNWIQLNKDAWKVEDWLMAKSPIAYRIFKYLINNMDSYNAVMCSYKVLQEQFKVSKPTITRAIKLLKDRKYIDVYKSGTSNVYAVNKNIVWNSWGTNFKHGRFGANIILTSEEQEEDVKNNIENEEE